MKGLDLKGNKTKIVLVAIGALFLLVLVMGTGGKKGQNRATIELKSKYQSLSTNIEVINKKLDERITKLSGRIDQQEQDIQGIKQNIQGIENTQEKLSDTLQKLQVQMQQIQDKLTQLSGQMASQRRVTSKRLFKQPPARITVVNIPQPKQKQPKKKQSVSNEYYVSLPDGSIVRGTIVTGIYAPITDKTWLPTLINVDEAFYGPNDTRIPLKNCKILATAQGDYTTKRAEVKLYEISCVLPNGLTKHYKITGYLSDSRDGAFGVHGSIISVTGEYIAGTFLTGFLSGASQAMAQAQTTTTTAPSTGTSVTNVTGNVARYTAFTGLSNSFSQLAQYYQGMLNKMVDMIYVPSGRRVWVVIQKGAILKGYKPTTYSTAFGGVD